MPTKLHSNILKAMNPLQFGLSVKLNALHCHATFMSEFYHFFLLPHLKMTKVQEFTKGTNLQQLE